MPRFFLAVLLLFSSCKFRSSGNFTPGAQAFLFTSEVITSGSSSSQQNSLVNFLGSKKTVIHFFASWCEPCLEELSSVQRLYQDGKGYGVTVVGVAFNDQKSAVEDLIKRYKLTFPIFLDNEKSEIQAKYEVDAVPESFVLDKEGKFILFSDIDGVPTVRLSGGRPWDNKEMREALFK